MLHITLAAFSMDKPALLTPQHKSIKVFYLCTVSLDVVQRVWGLDWGERQWGGKELNSVWLIQACDPFTHSLWSTDDLACSHTFSHTRLFTGGDTHKPCNWILCRKQTFSCKHIICHLYSLIHILYAKWRKTRAHTQACQTNKWGWSPCESHHHDHPSFIITLACSITQQHDLAWNQLAGYACTLKCTLPNLCFGLMENNV